MRINKSSHQIINFFRIFSSYSPYNWRVTRPLLEFLRCNNLIAPINEISFEISKQNNLSKKFETLPGVAQVALQMGKHVSKQIQNDLNNVERKTFNYKDLGEMATIGKSKAVVDILNLRFGGVIAWLIWLFVHLIAITNFKNKLMIFTQWFWGYLTSQRHSRIIR